MDKIIRIGFTVEEQLKIVEESSPDSLVLIFSMEGGFFYFSEKVIAALKKKGIKIIVFTFKHSPIIERSADQIILCGEIDLPGIRRHPGLHAWPLVLQADVELGGALGLHAAERVHRAGRAVIGREQLPVVRHAFTVTEAGVPGQAIGQVLLVAQETAAEPFLARLPGGRVRPVAHHPANRLPLVAYAGAVDAQPADRS